LSPVSEGSLRHLSVVAGEHVSGAFDRLVRKLRAAGYIQPDDIVSEEFKVLCPIHENTGKHAPSLNITKKEDGGVWVYCHGGCPNDRVFREIMADDAVLPQCRAERVTAGRGAGGLLISVLELHPERKDADELYLRWCAQESSETGVTEAATYVYRNAEGREVAAKVKWSNKEFTWLHRSGKLWQRGLRGIDGSVPLYRLDEVFESEGVVYVVEGEKDADRLWEDGLVATSSRLVGRSARKTLEPLAGRVVVVIPDNDESGRATAKRFASAAALAGVRQVRLMAPLGDEDKAGTGYDLSDWLDDGGSIGELEMLASTDELVEIIGRDSVVDSADGASVLDDTETVDSEEQDREDSSSFIGGVPGLTPELIADKEWSSTYLNDVVKSLRFKAARSDADELWLRLLGAEGGEGAGDSEVDMERLLAGDDIEKLPPPTVFRFTDTGLSLFYEGVINTVFGYGGHGKSMIMALAVAQALIDGKRAAYFTYELPPKILVARLMGLGATKEMMKERLHLYQSHIGAPKKLVERCGDASDEVLVVVDSTNKALIAHELDSDKVGGFGKLNNVLMRPLTGVGMTVGTIDHVTQNAETRNRMIGSVEKWNAIQGAAYKIERGRPFSMSESGWSSIQMMKDNPSATGWTADQTVGYLVVEANGLGQGLSRIWIQQAAPVSADRVSDLARLSAENGSREDVKKEQQAGRESAVVMEVMEQPGHWAVQALADELAGKYDGSSSTWRRVVSGLRDRGELSVDEAGRLTKVSVDIEYDASSEIA